MTICTICGKEIPDNRNICNSCVEDIIEDLDNLEDEEPPMPSQNRPKDN